MPRRRCAGCGRSAAKEELVRLALVADASGAKRLAVLDRLGTMPGRGAYLCREPSSGSPRPECVRLALRRGGVARALRAQVALHPEIVESVGP